MRKIISKVILCVGCFFIIYGMAFNQELLISPEMHAVLDAELSKPLRVYSLDLEEGRRIDEAFRDWVSGSMDLEKAQRRESDRFKDRVTYLQEMDQNIPRFLIEGFEQRGLENTRPIKIYYKRGPNWFSFRKLLDIEAGSTIERERAIELVRDFLLRNNFVRVTEFDTFGEIQVPELRRNYGSDPEFPGKVVLMMQGVKFQRKYMGSPVINSRISVDFHPDTEEILGFKHHNWTPVREGTGTPIPQELYKGPEDIEDNLREKIKKYCGPSERTEIGNIASAWFQTKTELIPILACEIRKLEQEDIYIEYINLAGSDDVFYPPRKLGVEPEVAPK
ncbi:MAG: hypothetical protein ACE5I5_15415 [Candidatus Heimdallarchaeota archaeon]